jgi:hypothetical protein
MEMIRICTTFGKACVADYDSELADHQSPTTRLTRAATCPRPHILPPIPPHISPHVTRRSSRRMFGRSRPREMIEGT